MLITAILFNQFSSAQNLVPNWSFEDTVSCPPGMGSMYLAVGWDSFRASPDYFNSCNSTAGIPINFAGYQNANFGNAYSGLYSYARSASNYREIIGIELSQYLMVGQKYYVSFYVNRAFNPIPGARINIASNKLGARFSTVPFTSIQPIPINNYAQVYTDSLIDDTMNWVNISGSFIADSAYKYLCIGNFFDDSLTTHLSYDSTAVFAYYYVDNIHVSTDSLDDIEESLNSFSISLFPNPTNSLLQIKNYFQEPIQLTIFSLNGEVIENISISVDELIIDAKNFFPGIYILQFVNKGGVIERKFVKY